MVGPAPYAVPILLILSLPQYNVLFDAEINSGVKNHITAIL